VREENLTQGRLLVSTDLVVALELMRSVPEQRELGGRVAELLPLAVAGTSDQIRAFGAWRDEALAGFALFGMIAGAQGAVAIHAVIVAAEVRRQHIGAALMHWIGDYVIDRGARLVVSEVPTSAALAVYRRFLARCGFEEEGRIDDYIADGVALAILRRDISRARPLIVTPRRVSLPGA
jgi:ribosomal protein S18 acetylase RimI-like enzyme